MTDAALVSQRKTAGVYAAAGILVIAFGAIAIWWAHVDSRPQQMDPATHLRRGLFFGVAMRAGDVRELAHLWRAEYGMYTYPPLFHAVSGVFIAGGSSPAV